MAINTATYTGESGVVRFSADSSGPVAMGSVRSFSIDQETQTIEKTAMGATAREYLPGLKQFSGSMDIYLNDNEGHNGGNNDLFQAIGGTSGSTAIELYPSGETTGVKLTGNVIITGHSITSNFDGMVEASVTFQGDGALTQTAL